MYENSRPVSFCLFSRIFLLAVIFFASRTLAEEVHWLFSNAAEMVDSSPGYSTETVSQEYWSGKIVNAADPILSLKSAAIDANKNKYLVIKIAIESGSSLQVFFGTVGIREEDSFRTDSLNLGGQTEIYIFDMNEMSGWKGEISKLRIDIDGATKNSEIKLYNIGVCNSVAEVGGDNAVIVASAAKSDLFDWMAAWHQTLVAIDEQRPNIHVGTYVNNRFSFVETYQLVKIVSGIEIGGKTWWPVTARQVRVSPFPGGVKAFYVLGGVNVEVEITPLLHGRQEIAWEGAALFTIKTDPATPVVIKCGDGEVAAFPVKVKTTFLRNDSVGIDTDKASISEDDLGVLESSMHPLKVCVSTSGKITAKAGDHGGQIVGIRMENGSGSVVAAFAKETHRAKELAKTDIVKARQEVDEYYNKLFETCVETPEKSINEAFRHALITLEYTWLKPFGWMECIHHWMAMWHMQASGGAAWIGQTDRAKECIVSHAKLLPDDAVPQYVPGGFTHRDFGGSNQYYLWQIRNYLHFTSDIELTKELLPTVDRVIKQTFKEYDPDNDSLLAWGLQIGNQEDFVATPYNGTSPAVDGIEMMLTRASMSRQIGDEKTAVEYENAAARMTSLLKQELWINDLGRFAYFKDPTGISRIDGQYHTQIYPVIYGLTDPLDSWTSIRYLRDRLIGNDGGVYCSNNFPNHVGGTWGMQAGAAQQPWGAWGLAAAGVRNETYRPLKWISDIVVSDTYRGSWPEVAVEKIPAYFSPPAGLFVQATVEALFGLQMHKPQGFLQVSPSFPDTWNKAKIKLPEFSAEYKRIGGTFTYTVQSKESIARHLRWMLPAGDIQDVYINGKKAKFDVAAGVDCILVSVNTATENTTRFEIVTKPCKNEIHCAKSIAEGDELKVEMTGCRIVKVEDREGVLASVQINDNKTIAARIKEGQLAPYLKFGRLGQLNFSRRTFFVLCRTESGTEFWTPVDVTILPRYEVTVRGQIQNDGSFDAIIRNNSFTSLSGQACLEIRGQSILFDVDLRSRSDSAYNLKIPQNMLPLLSVGDNPAKLVLPDKESLDVRITMSEAFKSVPALKSYVEKRIVSIELPQEHLQSGENWEQWVSIYSRVHTPWSRSTALLSDLEPNSTIYAAGLEQVPFRIKDRKLIAVSYKSGEPSVALDLGGREFKKLYLLILPIVDNHNMFSPVAQITAVNAEKKSQQAGQIGYGIFAKTLYVPGDLDWFFTEQMGGVFATAQKERQDRFGLLPRLESGKADWDEGKPPVFPQPDYWATCRVLKTTLFVMNVVELDFGKLTPIQSLNIAAVGADAAIGLVAISGETAGGLEQLSGTPYMPPKEFREPITLFNIEDDQSIKDWKCEGDAFSIASVPGLFGEKTLNSLAKSGEAAVGKVILPDFEVLPDAKNLIIYCQGGNSAAEEGLGLLAIDLVDSKTGQRLERLYIKGAHSLREEKVPLKNAVNKTVHLELLDMNANTSYAWLGFKKAVLE